LTLNPALPRSDLNITRRQPKSNDIDDLKRCVVLVKLGPVFLFNKTILLVQQSTDHQKKMSPYPNFASQWIFVTQLVGCGMTHDGFAR
jgi:hypothetical protein